MSAKYTGLPKKELRENNAPIGIGFNTGLDVDILNSIPSSGSRYSTANNIALPLKENEIFTPSPDEMEPDPWEVSAIKAEARRSQVKKRILLWLRDIGVAVLVAVLIMQFVRPTIVQQHSMEDTLQENDYIFLNRQAYNFGEIQRGDIFVFRHIPEPGSGDEEKNLIKRVIGLPGDKVSISDGHVYVNGEVIDDSYTKDGYTEGSMKSMEIPEDYVFALGDNRQNSFDSRDPALGLIDMNDIIGKAVFRAFPFESAGLIK